MRTSVDRGTPDSKKPWRKRLYPIGITIGSLVLACLIIGGALACEPAPPPPPLQHVTAAEIETACDLGVAWLAAQQNSDGSWGNNYTVGETGLALLKLEERAFELGYTTPFDTDYQYSENVTNGFNYLFTKANTIGDSNNPLPLQQHGSNWDNPDTNGDYMGVYFASSSGTPTYETGISMMAIAASRAPNMVVSVTSSSGSPVDGWDYEQVLQDTIDYLAFAQCDSGAGRGGWRYTENINGADNSASGYVVVGLQYAQGATAYGFNCTIPSFVCTELGYWINFVQLNSSNLLIDGGSRYGTQACSWANPDWENTLKTGNLLCEMAFVGDLLTATRVTRAINYIGGHWYDPNYDPGWGWNQQIASQQVAYYQATYSLMKGLKSMGVSLNGIPGVLDWYQDFADVIVPQQQPNGSWPQTYEECCCNIINLADNILSTEWALLTLERAAPPPQPCADNCTCLEDSVADNCNFIPCDNVTTSCSDNITAHCYTCPQGCECRPEAESENLTECAPSCPNPCPSGQKCYKLGWCSENISCLTDNITLNTGYDQVHGSTYPSGQRDDEWELVDAPASTGLYLPTPAWVIPPVTNWWGTYQDSQWISAYQSPLWNIANDDQLEKTYSFQRTICTCPDTKIIHISLNFMVDNMAWVYFDNNPIGSLPTNTTQNFQLGTLPIDTDISVSPTPDNKHYLRVDVRNAPTTGSINAMGLDIVGNVTIVDPPGGLFVSDNCCNPTGTIIVRKINDISGDGLPGWTIVGTDNATGATSENITDAHGYYYFYDLIPGTYTVCEELQLGWTQTIPGGPGCYTVTVGVNDTIELLFGNHQVPCGDNCTCLEDSVADNCSFVPCDNVTTSCSDNLTAHCYTCPQGCECRPEVGSENLTECAPSCPNPCPTGQKCYKSPCQDGMMSCDNITNLVNTVILNTGYDRVTGLPFDQALLHTPSTLPEPNWMLTIAPEVINPPAAMPLAPYDCGIYPQVTTPATSLGMPSPTWVIEKHGSWVDSLTSRWISAYPKHTWEVNNSNPCPYQNYSALTQPVQWQYPPYRFERAFCVCSDNTDIVINFDMLVDNIADVYLDNVYIGGQMDTWYGSFQQPKNITTTRNVNRGVHYLDIDVRNDSAVSMGLNVSGSITASSGLPVFLDDIHCQPTGKLIVKKVLSDNSTVEPNEPGLPGWTITVTDNATGAVTENITDANGYSYFNYLCPATYTVCEEPQPNWIQTIPGGQGCYTVTLQAGSIIEVDFGNHQVPCGDNCTCLEDSVADNCSFVLCDNVTTSCSDNITAHCYTCPQGCECRPEAGSENLTECAPSCPNPCPSGQKCYEPCPPGCDCLGWNPVTVTWTDAQQQLSANNVGTGFSISHVDPGTSVYVSATENCSSGCALSENWTVTDYSSNVIIAQNNGATASFAPSVSGPYTVTFSAKCGCVTCPQRSVTIGLCTCGKCLSAGVGNPPCNFSRCDNATYPCWTDFANDWCYKCPLGCECLPSDNATGMQECVSDNCSYNPCPTGQKCYPTIPCTCRLGRVTATWTDVDEGSQILTNLHCGDHIGIGALDKCTDVKITCGGQCSAGCVSSNYTWSVIDLSGSGDGPWSGNGLNASFKPTHQGSAAHPSKYLATFTAHCNGTTCTCQIGIGVKAVECTCHSIGNPVTVNWPSNSSPTSWSGTIGGTDHPVITNVNTYSSINVNPTFNSTWCSSGTPTYHWWVMLGSNLVNDGTGANADFQAQPISQPGGWMPTAGVQVYTVTWDVTCDNCTCPGACSLTIECPYDTLPITKTLLIILIVLLVIAVVCYFAYRRRGVHVTRRRAAPRPAARAAAKRASSKRVSSKAKKPSAK